MWLAEGFHSHLTDAVAWERVFGILWQGETELLMIGMKHPVCTQEQNSPQILSAGEVGNQMLASS